MSPRPRRTAAVRLAAITGVLAALVIVASASAASFEDPVGDVSVSPSGSTLSGLDIARVEVTNRSGPDELVTFRITLVGAPSLPPVSIVAVLLDTDKNASTGEEGTDAMVIFDVDSARLVVGRYDQGTGAFTYVESDPPATYEDGTVVLSVVRFLLNDTRSFRFAVLTIVGPTGSPAAVAVDLAPDPDAATYDLVGLPPPLTFQRPIGEPTRPGAGQRFTVTSTVLYEETGEIVRRGKVTCVARVGKKQVRATGRFTGAGAQCAMNIPRGTRGKTLRGSIKVQASGANGVRTFAYRIT